MTDERKNMNNDMRLTKIETHCPLIKILDVTYTIIPSSEFVSQMKAANKRHLLAEEQGEEPSPPTGKLMER